MTTSRVYIKLSTSAQKILRTSFNERIIDKLAYLE